MIVKLLTEHHLEFLGLKGGHTGSTESTLVKCWKSHATLQLHIIAFQDIAEWVGIECMPTFAFYKNGEKVSLAFWFVRKETS